MQLTGYSSDGLDAKWHLYIFPRNEKRYYKKPLTLVDLKLVRYMGLVKEPTQSHWDVSEPDKEIIASISKIRKDAGDGHGFDGPIYNIETPVYTKAKKVVIHDVPSIRKSTNKTGNCCYCQIPLDESNYTREHIIPVSRGGKAGKNLRPCCQPCNTEKSDMMLHTYIQYLNLMILEYPVGSDAYKTTQRKIINANEIAKTL